MPPKKKGAEAEAASKAKAKAKEERKVLTRDERASVFLEKFNQKARGHAQLKRASEYILPFLTKRLPTGLLQLDLALRGGFPAGGLSQIVGARSAGKSWLYWQVIRQLQYILGPALKVLFAMTEMKVDRTQGQKAGVAIALADEDIEALNKGRQKNGGLPFTQEEIASYKREVGTFHELHGESAEYLYDGILGAVENNIYHLIIIDSFGSIVSAAEAENESLANKTYGGASGVNTQFLRKLCSFLTMDDENMQPRDTAIIGINQIRDAIGDPNIEFKSPGGRMLEHTKFVDLWVASGRQVSYKDSTKDLVKGGTKDQWIQTGKEVNWKILKGKAGIHEGAVGSYLYDFRIGQADFYSDAIVAGLKTGVIEQAGSYLGIRDPEKPDEFLLRCNSWENFYNGVVQDVQTKAAAGESEVDLLNLIRTQCYRKLDININYDWSE